MQVVCFVVLKATSVVEPFESKLFSDQGYIITSILSKLSYM